MSSTGNVFPGTGANDAGIGATAWVTPGNITADDTVNASCTAAASSQYLVAKNFNFSAVPVNATIAGITVRIEAAESSTGSETLNARIQDEGGALTGTGKTASINGTSPTVYTLGSTSDVWSATPTGAKVHDADWGVRFWYTTAHNMTVDYVTMALEYTVPGLGTATETDTALPLTDKKIGALGIAAEADAAVALVGKKVQALGVATSTEQAFPLTGKKIGALGLAAETAAALALTALKKSVWGLALETDEAFALSGSSGGGEPAASTQGTSGLLKGMR